MFNALVSRGLWCPPTIVVTAPAIVDCISTVTSTVDGTTSLTSLAGPQISVPDTGCAAAELTSAAGDSDLESS